MGPRRILIAALLLGLPTIGCERSDNSSVAVRTHFYRSGAEADTNALDRVLEGLAPTALGNFRLDGVRLVEFFDRGAEAVKRLAFRERVVTDGSGRYSIRPVERLTQVEPDPVSFELRQVQHQGLNYRYRDFAVRDRRLFLQNYRLTELASESTVAGRLCDEYEVSRRDGEGSTWRLALDRDTGLLLASSELDEHGELAARWVFESFELDTEPGPVAYHLPMSDETEVELRELSQQARQASGSPWAEAFVPRFAPDGFELCEAATVAEMSGRRWLKLTYLDGVEPLFFLCALDPEQGSAAQTVAGAPQRRPDEIVVYRMGTATVAQGHVRDRDLIAVGQVDESVLLDLIQSSVP